jgi:hypothetical protein
MSKLITQWLNDDIKLSVPLSPDSLDSVFRNGYLLGELLDRLLLSESGSFKTGFTNSTAIDAAIRNFSNLEQCLREKMGIQLTSSTAIDLITAKHGCAARLLHQIKSGLSKKQMSIFEGKSKVVKPHLPPLNRAESTMSYPGAPDALPLIPRFNYTSPAKQVYNEQSQRFFADLLRSKLKQGDLLKAPQPAPVSHRRKREAAAIAKAREPVVAPPIKRRAKIPLWDDPPPPRTLTPELDGVKFVLPNPGALDSHIREKIQFEKGKVVVEVFWG